MLLDQVKAILKDEKERIILFIDSIEELITNELSLSALILTNLPKRFKLIYAMSSHENEMIEKIRRKYTKINFVEISHIKDDNEGIKITGKCVERI